MEVADNALSDGIDGNVSAQLRKYAEGEGFVDGFFYMDKEGNLIFPQEMPRAQKKLAEIEPLYLDGDFYMAEECEFFKNDLAEAARLYEDSLKGNLTDAQKTVAINAAARCYFKLARYDDAISKYNRLLEIDQMVLIAKYQIGLCNKLQGKSREATETFLSLYDNLIKCQWRADSEQDAYFRSKARDSITELLKNGNFPALKEQFSSLEKLEETLAKEMAFLAVLKSLIIPKFRSHVEQDASPFNAENSTQRNQTNTSTIRANTSAVRHRNNLSL